MARLKGTDVAKSVKGMRWVLLRNWANLTTAQRVIIRDLETTSKSLFRAWLLKEELADIVQMQLEGALPVFNALFLWLGSDGVAA